MCGIPQPKDSSTGLSLCYCDPKSKKYVLHIGTICESNFSGSLYTCLSSLFLNGLTLVLKTLLVKSRNFKLQLIKVQLKLTEAKRDIY